MPPIPETASVPSTCSASSLRSVEPKCSCPSNQSPVKPRPSAASKISPKGEANVVVTTSGSFQTPHHNTANCADNPNRPQSHPKQQARSAAAAARPQSPHRQQAQRAAAAGRAPQSPKAAGAKRRGRRRDQGPQQPRAPHISPAAPTNNGPIADCSQPSHRRRGPGLAFRTLRTDIFCIEDVDGAPVYH